MEAERYAFKTNKRKIVHLPVNRIETPYQTEKALDEDKIKENMRRMRRGERMEPCVVGLDYDLHDGHHRLEAAKRLGHTHVPCRVGAVDDEQAQKAYDEYTQAYKAFRDDLAKKSSSAVVNAGKLNASATGYSPEVLSEVIKSFDEGSKREGAIADGTFSEVRMKVRRSCYVYNLPIPTWAEN